VIRWLVAAALVAGTFGVVWTAPWQDYTEYLTAEATHRLGTTFSTIGLRADRHVCNAVARPPKPDEIAAVAIVLAELRVHPAARLAPLDGDAGAATVREVAATRSRDIASCLSKATVRGTGWVDLLRRLDAGLAAATPG
jgi:hypothetical protein